jgi:hypothetical protein
MEAIGKVVPGDDVEELPLQAADLIASMFRKRLATPPEYFSRQIHDLLDSGQLHHSQCREKELRKFMNDVALARALRAVRDRAV